MKILDAVWFNYIGIVKVEDPYEGIKYYIKEIPRESDYGFRTEKDDMKYIAEWGSTFPNDAGDVLFGVKS